MTVSYFPELSVLADGHSNVVNIVNEDWSVYMLKYSAKAVPTGDLALSDEQLFKLAFADKDEYSQVIAARYAKMQVYSPTELALFGTGTKSSPLRAQ